MAAPAMAHQCVNASKANQAAGVQVVIDATTGEIVWTTRGLANRFDQGLVGPDGEGFHGLVGLDFDGDMVVDMATFIVGPGDQIPLNAQSNGDPCHGITNIETFFAECVG
ncbi:MAG TPA: hypothetical protein VFI44_06985 [Ornithinibacter sp.]|nr:hypothetical protein [Ornithinibacter sp.]